ncbi:MAG TPA: acylphosphatase [Lapillicoccus sp.]|nr:acylphosphatase [Lapillicoccus sp.]
MGSDDERATVFIRGDVQGVGFRFWARRQARALGLVGHAKNLPDGRVEVVAQGSGDAVDRLIALLEEDPTSADRPGTVRGVVTQWGRALPGVGSFEAK